jgi:hypothetical protein
MRVTSRIKKLVRPTLGVLYAARIAFAENVTWGNNLRSYSFKFTAWMPGTTRTLKRCH